MNVAHEDTVWCICWTANNEVVTASGDGGIRIWDVTDPHAPKHHIKAPGLSVISLSVDASGSKVLSASLEGTVCLSDIQKGKIVCMKETRSEEVLLGDNHIVQPAYHISLHPSGTSWASTGHASRVAIYGNLPDLDTFADLDVDEDMDDAHLNDPEQSNGHQQTKRAGASYASLGECVKVVSVFPEDIADDRTRGHFGMDLKYSHDGSVLAVSTHRGFVAIIDATSYDVVKTFSAHALPVRSLAWTPDSQFLFSSGDDRRIVLYDVKTGTQSASSRAGSVTDIHGHKGWVLSLSVSSDGSSLVSGSADATVKVWDITDISQIRPVSSEKTSDMVWTVAFRPSEAGELAGVTGKAFVSGGDSNRVTWWKSAGSS